MDTRLSDDQQALEDHCRRLLDKEWPLSRAREILGPDGGGHDDQIYALVANSGWLGLTADEQLGGSGASLVDLGLVFRAAGYALLPASFYSTVHAAMLIEAIALPAQARQLLPDILSGRSLACVAGAERHATETVALWQTNARPTDGGWILQGEKCFVPFADRADNILVAARVDGEGDKAGFGIFAVPRDAVQPVAQKTFGGEQFFRIPLAGMTVEPGALLGGPDALGRSLAAFDDVREKMTCLQAMEMTGGIQAVLDCTVDYVTERVVFGKPVAANQTVQHMLANIYIRLAGVKLAALKAIHLKASGSSATRELSVAKLCAGKLYTEATVTAQQLWGSMGYARETGLYLWSERAKVSDATFGTRRFHRMILARHMNGGGS